MSAVNDKLSSRVFLRPIGSPLTLGMAGLAIASLVQSGFDLRWIAKSQALEVGLILVAVPLVLQALASVFAYWRVTAPPAPRSACWRPAGWRWGWSTLSRCRAIAAVR